jgi:hypothetical protein
MANGYGLWTEMQGAVTYSFYGAAQDGHPTGSGIMMAEGWPLIHIGDFKKSGDAIIPEDLEDPEYLLEVSNGNEPPPRRVATVADLSPTYATLYADGMAAAIKAFEAEAEAREAIKGE